MGRSREGVTVSGAFIGNAALAAAHCFHWRGSVTLYLVDDFLWAPRPHPSPTVRAFRRENSLTWMRGSELKLGTAPDASSSMYDGGWGDVGPRKTLLHW